MFKILTFLLLAVFAVGAISGVNPEEFNEHAFSGVKPEKINEYDSTKSIVQDISPINNTVTVRPDGLQRVVISNKDVNMIMCRDSTITDRTFSEEKPLTYKKSPSSDHIAFIKVLSQKQGNDVYLHSGEIELYITCGTVVYSMILIPEAINTQKIILEPGKKAALKTNIKLFSDMPIEDAATSLIDKVQFNSVLPDSFTVINSNDTSWIDLVAGKKSDKVLPIKVKLIKRVSPDGIGMEVYEYLVFATEDFSLNEFDFAYLTQNAFAIRLANSQLKKHGVTKAFIVERRWQ